MLKNAVIMTCLACEIFFVSCFTGKIHNSFALKVDFLLFDF